MEKELRSATTRDSDKYIVRFPEGMRERLHEVARLNNRTLNAEIVARLQASFEAAPPAPDDEFTVRVALEMNEARLEALRSQMFTMDLHREVLVQRLDVLMTSKRSTADVRDVKEKLAAAESELAQLHQRRDELLKESWQLHERHSEATSPLRKQVAKQAELKLQQEIDEAERQEAERMAALVELNPTSEELQRVAEIVAGRQRKQMQGVLGGVKQPGKSGPTKKAPAGKVLPSGAAKKRVR